MSFILSLGRSCDRNNIHEYLEFVDCDFEYPLSSKVNLSDFCQKILDNGKFFMVKDGEKIIGLIAFYCNDQKTHIAHLSILSTLSKYRGCGIARMLILASIECCKENGMNLIRCDSVNPIAIHLYESIGFKCYNEQILGNNHRKTFLEYYIK